MESKNTEKSNQSTSKHVVTYIIRESKYATPKKITDIIEGDFLKWVEGMKSQFGEFFTLEFAMYIW